VNRNHVALALFGGFSYGLALQANAVPITFDFNTVAISGSHSNGLGATGGDTAIGTYMTGILHSSIGPSASANSSGALATQTYNGEGHVNGDSLGTSDNGVHHTGNDTFLMNDDFGIYGSATSQFSLTFTGFYIYSVSFDWQIFPDASCPASSSPTACANNPSNSNYPDIELLANGVNVWSALATTPVSGDKDPQGIGHLSNLAVNGVTTLTFVDWPAEIGMDNLVINGCTIQSPNCLRQDAPEPSTLLLFGGGALAAWRLRKRSRSA